MPEKKKKAAIPARAALAVSVSVIGDRNATAACASMVGGHYTAELIQAAGTAKRMQGDRYHPEIGTDLAVGRALLELGLQLIQRGDSLVQLEAETKHTERFLASMQRTERALRSMGPHPGVLPVSEVLEKYGREAAEVSTRRRREKAQRRATAVERQVSPPPPEGGRANGLPTVDGKGTP